MNQKEPLEGVVLDREGREIARPHENFSQDGLGSERIIIKRWTTKSSLPFFIAFIIGLLLLPAFFALGALILGLAIVFGVIRALVQGSLKRL